MYHYTCKGKHNQMHFIVV